VPHPVYIRKCPPTQEGEISANDIWGGGNMKRGRVKGKKARKKEESGKKKEERGKKKRKWEIKG
jgi:hypothetical protein